MMFSPAIISLLIGSALVALMLLYSCYYGGLILCKWNLRSGSELQLELERRTSLISTLVSYALGFQAFSLFLFVYTADSLAPFFVGAMCAAGSLNVNQWGYATILLKVVNLLFAGVWLIANHTDGCAFDYPLIKAKYSLLVIMTPLVTVEAILQTSYFFALKPNVITSCCGRLFTPESAGMVGAVLALPRASAETAFGACLAVMFALGIWVYKKMTATVLFSLATAAAFVASVVGLIAFISPYFYELPTHHCPFCVLQREYGYVGYPIYFTLLIGTVSGLGTGIVGYYRKRPSLKQAAPRIQRRLVLAALISYALFIAITMYGVAASNLRM